MLILNKKGKKKDIVTSFYFKIITAIIIILKRKEKVGYVALNAISTNKTHFYFLLFDL